MSDFGSRPEDVVTDFRGNVQPDITLTFYASQADATAQTTPLGSATTDSTGRWSFTTAANVIYVRTPAGDIYPCAAETGTGGVTDHGLLTGLADDDHTQYHTDARGDARYTQKASNLSDVANAATARTNLGAAATSHTHAAADVNSGTLAVARIGSGTAAAGKYVDGGTGAWTALPSGGPGTVAFAIALASGAATYGASFTTVDYGATSPTLNVGGGTWSSNIYTIPVTGTYVITISARRADNVNVGSAHLNIHTSNADDPTGQWMSDNGGTRWTHTHTRVAHFASGAQLRQFVYWTTTQTLTAASISLVLVSAA